MENKDEQLWRLAKKRANFKKQFASYVIINLFLWGIWWFTKGYRYDAMGVPWPAWCTLGWGFGLAFSYYNAYYSNDVVVTKEYEKLKNKENQ